jgi:predicted deacylase
VTSLLRTHGFKALQPGKRLIVLGAVHGNETCGTRGIARVLAELDSGALQITRGSVTFVPVTNPLAYQRAQRAGDRNLNRNLRPNDQPQTPCARCSPSTRCCSTCTPSTPRASPSR